VQLQVPQATRRSGARYALPGSAHASAD